MALTFENLAAHNRRFSILLVIFMVVLTAAVAGLFFFAVSSSVAMPSPSLITTGAMWGAGFAGVGSLATYFLGARIITGVSHAQALEKQQDPELFNVVEEMAIAAGLPCPAVYLINDQSPNAFATGTNPSNAVIGITSGLREKLSRDELQAVVAHEMAHIKNYDIRLMMLVAVYAGLIVLLCDLFRSLARHGRVSSGRHRSSSNNQNQGAGPFILVAMFLALVLSVVAPLLAKLLKLAVSREREYLADATAVQLCRNPQALASALRKIATDTETPTFANDATEHLFIMNPNPKSRLALADRDSVWSTHPPISKRIAKLNLLSGQVSS